jgi:hypothetical protein
VFLIIFDPQATLHRLMQLCNIMIQLHAKFHISSASGSLITIMQTESNGKKKQSRYREFQEVKVPRFLDNGRGWW